MSEIIQPKTKRAKWWQNINPAKIGAVLVAIGTVVSAVWLLACIAVVVLFFTGGAGEWYQRRRGY